MCRVRLYHHWATASRSTSSRKPCTIASSRLLPAALPLESAGTAGGAPSGPGPKYNSEVGSRRWRPWVSDHTGVHSAGAVASKGAATRWSGEAAAFQLSRSRNCRAAHNWQRLGCSASPPSARSESRITGSSP